MKVETARSYIKKRVQTTRTGGWDNLAKTLPPGSRKSHAEHAQFRAEQGSPGLTASHLNLTTLPIDQQGVILAKAYTRGAEGLEGEARDTTRDDLAANYRREAQKFRRIAHGLARAAQRA